MWMQPSERVDPDWTTRCLGPEEAVTICRREWKGTCILKNTAATHAVFYSRGIVLSMQ